jgi:hypothetical protein
MWELLWGSKKGTSATRTTAAAETPAHNDEDDDDDKKPPTAPETLARAVAQRVGAIGSLAGKREPTHAETMAQLRANIESMTKQEEFLAVKINEQMAAAATALRAKNKSRALHCMSLKKLYEKRQADLEHQKFNVEQQLVTLATARVTIANVQSMKDGAAMLKRLQTQVSSEDAHDTIVDIEAQMAESDAISAELALPMGTTAKEVDEDEMLNELKEFMAETDATNDPAATSTTAATTTTTTSLPTMPKAPIVEPVSLAGTTAAAARRREKDKDDEAAALKQLEAEMVMTR